MENKPSSKVGFVSLGCPKNLVDSERILTQLKTEGYDVVSSYNDAELVIVNTCGFIDSAVKESLDTIGEALTENGKVLVTGCLGANENEIKEITDNKLIREFLDENHLQGFVGSKINICCVSEHPFASVTVTLIRPGARPVRFAASS